MFNSKLHMHKSHSSPASTYHSSSQMLPLYVFDCYPLLKTRAKIHIIYYISRNPGNESAKKKQKAQKGYISYAQTTESLRMRFVFSVTR